MFLALAAESTKHSCFPQESEQLDEDSSSGSTSGSSSSSGSSGSDGGSPGPVTRPRGPPSNRAIQAGTTPAALRTRGHVERKGAAKGGGSTMGFTGQQMPPRRAPAEREEGPANAPRTRDKRPPPPVPAQLLIECSSSNSNEGTFGQN